MKMAKKLLAVVLAGVLAVSLLTGCGGAVSTMIIAGEAVSAETIADAMSNMSKGEGVVYEEKPELNEKAGLIAEEFRRRAKNDSGNKTDIYGEIMAIMGDDYDDKYIWIAVTATEGGNVRMQAENLLEDVDEDEDSNINSAVPKGTSPAKVRSIGTVPITENGVDYLFAVITADAVQDEG